MGVGCVSMCVCVCVCVCACVRVCVVVVDTLLVLYYNVMFIFLIFFLLKCVFIF